jgi:surfeit locus 1 family protein
LRGSWDHDHSMLLGPRVREGTPGFHIVTPLIRDKGSTVLIDRGFLSKESVHREIHSRNGREVEVLGLLRAGHARNRFTPENRPEEGIWHWVDLPAMAEYAGGAEAGVQPVFVEEIFGK